ncbi:MAG: sugar phosphate isomerase/epimerase family protein [Lacrimispora sp.]|uniref:sugar phosphate isomerase/epimerase family protein n=1 Tax=Lacrimispora sp. TaxID=2719234 RepID=UPI0039E5A931
MDYAGRMNSFIFKGKNVFDAIAAYRNMQGITHLEFNYPEHIEGNDLEEIRKAMGPLKVNGFAIRWRNFWKNGNFANPDQELRKEAIDITKKAADSCRSLGGNIITLWLENDGFDYSFQMDYMTGWNQIVDAIREVADYAPDMKMSIEYKPFGERNFAMLDSAGMTLFMVNTIDRPNVGVTFDFCHMLMKRENPSYGLALAASQGKLFGLHMNDGYSHQDSGLIFGTIHHAQSLEFVYYLRKYNYQGVVFFDTFPIREAADLETQANIDSFERYLSIVDGLGVEKIDEIVKKHDGISSQELIIGMLR